MSTLTILVVSFVFLLLIGMPVFMSLAVCATIALLFSDMLPLAVVHTSLFEGMNIFPLLAIPCFLVAGSLMEKGTSLTRLSRWSRSSLAACTAGSD
jgi:C4-dicarboxylate transporter, DctM subunit